MRGFELVAAERERQLTQEGWTSEHDDGHNECQLSLAAREYLEVGLDQTLPTHLRDQAVDEDLNIVGAPVDMGISDRWPWAPEWWKPSEDPIRNLVKAGALIVAEIDRLCRVQEAQRNAQRNSAPVSGS